MRRKVFVLLISAALATSTLAGCGSNKHDSKQEKTSVSSSNADDKQKTEDKTKESKNEETDGKDDTAEKKISGEEGNQIGKGVNGDIPEPDYSYEGIVNGPVGLYPYPYHRKEYSTQQWLDINDEWKKVMEAEVDKIENLWKRMLQIRI